MERKKILVLCTGNSCRSQMAESYLRHFAGEHAEIFSAGIETHGVNPKAIEIMTEDGIDISKPTSNHVDEYQAIPFDYMITDVIMQRKAAHSFLQMRKNFIKNFPDPAKAAGTEEEIMKDFRRVRDMIKDYAKDFITSK